MCVFIFFLNIIAVFFALAKAIPQLDIHFSLRFWWFWWFMADSARFCLNKTHSIHWNMGKKQKTCSTINFHSGWTVRESFSFGIIYWSSIQLFLSTQRIVVIINKYEQNHFYTCLIYKIRSVLSPWLLANPLFRIFFFSSFYFSVIFLLCLPSFGCCSGSFAIKTKTNIGR